MAKSSARILQSEPSTGARIFIVDYTFSARLTVSPLSGFDGLFRRPYGGSSVIAVVVSRADYASEHIGEFLLSETEWSVHEDESRPDAEGGGEY